MLSTRNVYLLIVCILNFAFEIYASCANQTSCENCVGSTFNPASGNCKWCSSSSVCLAYDDNDSPCPNEIDECQDSYYTVIFIVVLSALFCLCCGTCCLHKVNLHGDDGSVWSPSFPQFLENTTAYLFRSSIANENEWMCIICGFDNNPKVEYCVMCGTSHQFSSDYKTEKNLIKQQKRERKKQRKEKKMQQQQQRDVDIKIPYDAQVIDASIHSVDTLRSSLSRTQRAEVFNYRRLNHLSLRQKSARRRRMWQRVYDPEADEVKWIRSTVKETKVGRSLFGYSPQKEEKSSSSLFSFGRKNSNQSSVSDTSCRDSVFDPLLGSSFSSTSGGGVFYSPVKGVDDRKRDSFDDVLVSSSPGFTSVFGAEGGLEWEQVETGTAATINRSAPHKPRNSNVSGPFFSPPPASLQKLSFEDLEAAAALTFTEKQIWFLKRIEGIQRPWNDGYVRFEVSRNNILHDSCRCMLMLKKSDLHKWMRIQFYGQPGVDAGGLEREWFGLVVAELLNPKNGLFIASSAMDSSPGYEEDDFENSPMSVGNGSGGYCGGSFHINPLSAEFIPNHLEYFQFAGRLFGKAILEQQSIDAPLSLPLRKQILSLPITFSDLEFVDDELFRNLKWLQTHDRVEDLGLDFTVTYTYTPNRKKELSKSNLETPEPNSDKCAKSPKKVSIVQELKKGGADILVTDQNKAEYLQLKLRHRMLDSIKPQLESFLRGFYEVIPGDLLSVFDYQELDLLMCGLPCIDLEDWKKHTEYLGEYALPGAKHKVIKWFWEVVDSFDNEERVRLLQFTTGCSRLPPSGFKALQSNNGTYRKFNIQSLNKKDCPYPRAHTCFNKLDLPVYGSKSELEAYLSCVVSMEETTGFTMD